MNIIRKLLLSVTCIATILSLSGYAFAAGSGSVEVSKLEMAIKNITLKTGQSRVLNVSVSPGKTDDKSITWSTSDSSVATVRAAADSGKATVTAVGEGKAKITATSRNGKTAVCSVIVSDNEIEVKRIEMIAETATIRINQKKTLSVQFSPRDADDKTVIWDSENPKVAIVEEDGTVIGISSGTAEITAMSANGKTAVCTVTVITPALTEAEQRTSEPDNKAFTSSSGADKDTSISGNISMTIGKEKDLSGYIKYKEIYKDSDGEWQTEWQLRGKVSWASSFQEVVSVNDKGVAVAHRAGMSRITATGRDESGRTHVQTIVVGVSSGIKDTTVNSFEISESARLDFQQLAELQSGAKNMKWTSSVPDIASVDSNGLVLAKSIGRCTVTASYTDEKNTEQAIKYQVRVTAIILSNKTKNSTIALKAGDEIDLGKLYYPNYQDLPSVLNQYYCTTGTQNILSVNGLSLSAKSAGTSSVLIHQNDKTGETICHKLTTVVKK